MVQHIAQAEEVADCSKSVAKGAAVHRSTTAAAAATDSCRLPHCCSSKNPFPEFLINIFIIIRFQKIIFFSNSDTFS